MASNNHNNNNRVSILIVDDHEGVRKGIRSYMETVKDFEVVGEDTTTFDQGSMRFIAPVDMYSQTTVYDKYLKFPHRTILG